MQEIFSLAEMPKVRIYSAKCFAGYAKNPPAKRREKGYGNENEDVYIQVRSGFLCNNNNDNNDNNDINN